jgi:UrcA family protein
MQTKSHLIALMSVLALGAAGLGQSAFAQSDEAPSMKVQFADLNLSSAPGAQTMLKRIQHAADAVCGPRSSQPIDRVARLREECVNQAISQAVSQLRSPMVTAIYTGAPGAAPTTLASAR